MIICSSWNLCTVVPVDAANDLAFLKAVGKFSPLPIAAKERKEHKEDFLRSLCSFAAKSISAGRGSANFILPQSRLQWPQ